MRAFSIAWKDTRHTYRSIAGVAMMLAAPLLLALALGAAFGGGDSFSIADVKTVVVDQDEGAGTGIPAVGATLTAALLGPEMSDLLDVVQVDSPDEAKALVESGDAHVAVIIPSGLTATLMSSATGAIGQQRPAGSSTAVQIYKDPSLNIGPSIVAAIVQSVAQTFNGARAAAAASVQLAMSHGIIDPGAMADLATAAAESYAVAAPTGALFTIENRAPQVPGVKEMKHPNVASQVLVGMMLFFMLFGAATPARSILDEHREGTLSRLFTTPVPRSVILAGKYVAVFLVVLIQVVVLVVAGWLLFGADWGEPGPVAVLILFSALVASSLGLVTVSFAKTPAQAGAVSSAIFVFLGLISGNFTGTADVGALTTVRRVSPLGWLMEAWTDLLFGGSWSAIFLPVVVTLGFTVVLFGIATFFFRRRYA